MSYSTFVDIRMIYMFNKTTYLLITADHVLLSVSPERTTLSGRCADADDAADAVIGLTHTAYRMRIET